MNVPRPPDFRSLPRRCGRTSVSRRSSGNRRGEHHPCPPRSPSGVPGRTPPIPTPHEDAGIGPVAHSTAPVRRRTPAAGRPWRPAVRGQDAGRPATGPKVPPHRSATPAAPTSPPPRQRTPPCPLPGAPTDRPPLGASPSQAPPGPSTPCVPLEARLDGSTGPVRLLPAAGIKDAVVVRRWGRRPFRSASRLVRPSSWPLGGTAGPAGCSGCSIP
jgi:hypothetical protein